MNVNGTKTLINEEKCSNHESLQQQLKNYQGGTNFTQNLPHGLTTWEDRLKSALSDLVNLQTKRRSDRTQIQSFEELSDVCSQIVLKRLYFGRNGRLDILWSVNQFARTVAKCTGACDKRFARLISYIHHAHDYREFCHVGHAAQHC